MSVSELQAGQHGAAAPALAPLPAATTPSLGTRRPPGAGEPGQVAGAARARPAWWGRLAPFAVPAADFAALVAAVATTRAGGQAAVYAAATFTLLAAGGGQRLRICLRVSDQVGRIVTAATLPLAVLLPWLPASAALRLALSSAVAVVLARAGTFAALRGAHRRGLLMERALVVGSGALGTRVARLLGEHRELGLAAVGFLDSTARATPPAHAGDPAVPFLGQPADLGRVTARYGVSRVIVCLPAGRDEDLVPVLRAGRPARADVCVVPRLHELGIAVPRACLDEIWGIPLLPLRRYGYSRAALLAKRAVDLLASILLLALLTPLMATAALIIRLRSGHPALFRQTRLTGHGRRAGILKLRTLANQPSPDTQWVVPAAQSTALGRVLRATHLDELPQLINVLRGDMSLVGPRPERPYFAARFAQQIPGYADRHRAPAGITGWAQVHGLNGDTPIEDRARFDNNYIEYWSLWLDLTVLGRTVAACVPGPSRGGRK